MVLDVDVLNGCVTVDGVVVWKADAPNAPAQEVRPVRCLDLAAKLLMGSRAGGEDSVFVLFDEEEFPDSILSTRMVKRFVKKTGVEPEMIGRSHALARFPWGEIEFSVDPKQGDLSIAIRRC